MAERGSFLRRCPHLAGFVGVASKQGQAARVLWLAGATEALLEQTGAPLPREERTAYTRAVASAQASLGEEASVAVWAEGQAADLAAVIAAATRNAGPTT
jgi:hypothetical protein